MASKPLQYVVVERKITFGKHAGKIMKIAQPSGRQRIPFRRFCDEVARSTSFTRQEVEAVINYATEIAKDFVTNGDMVDFGDLGTLVPSFKSRAVGKRRSSIPTSISRSLWFTYAHRSLTSPSLVCTSSKYPRKQRNPTRPASPRDRTIT